MKCSILMRRTAAAGSAFVLALAADFATKWLILNIVMVPARKIEVTPFFNLTLGFNTGFGMFRDLFLERPLLLSGINMVIVAGLLAWAVRAKSRYETVSFGLIAGGATGNIVDRVRQGMVTDFLDFHIGGWHWPAFNMADVMIFIGVFVLIASPLFPKRSALPVQ